jgi:streptomycin 6-kinase
VRLPDGVLAFAARGPAWAAFVERLPGLLRGLTAEWGLVVDGPPTHGFCALVVPVRTDGAPAMLKIAFPDEESQHEALVLQHWGGRGAARLLRADPHRRALLLERLHTRDLNALGDLEACEVVGELYGRLHVPAPPQLQTVASYVDRWTAALAGLPRDAPIPRRLVEQARSLAGDLTADSTDAGRIVHGDLHGENVLAADREPWLVIDPKGMSGDPHYEPAPMLWNRWDEVVAGGHVRHAVRRRFHTVIDAAGLDEDRARDWVVVRHMHNALWSVADAEAAGQRLTGEDQDWITRCITIAKAVQG